MNFADITPQYLILGVIWYIVFLFSTTCHEGAHALAAKLGGDNTAFAGGQVTLNPLPHIRRELFGLVLVPIVSYFLAGWMIGWASAPYDPAWQERYPRRAALMALAGPSANLALVIASAIAIRIGLAVHAFNLPEQFGFTHVVDAAGPGVAGFAATFLSIVFVLNLLLFTFNLLPVPPLDGSSAVTLLMPERTALGYMHWVRTGGFAIFGLVVAWYAFDKIFVYVLRFGLKVLFSGLDVL
jgi:Zn-dependent protease